MRINNEKVMRINDKGMMKLKTKKKKQNRLIIAAFGENVTRGMKE